jgi:hypothetical protein
MGTVSDSGIGTPPCGAKQQKIHQYTYLRENTAQIHRHTHTQLLGNTVQIQGVYERMVRFQKLTRNVFLTLRGQNTHKMPFVLYHTYDGRLVSL